MNWIFYLLFLSNLHKFLFFFSVFAGQWFSTGTQISSNNKTDCHDITEILLKVALNTITLTPSVFIFTCKAILTLMYIYKQQFFNETIFTLIEWYIQIENKNLFFSVTILTPSSAINTDWMVISCDNNGLDRLSCWMLLLHCVSYWWRYFRFGDTAGSLL